VKLSSTRSLSTSQCLHDYTAVNEPIRDYLPGSTDRERLEKRLSYFSNTCSDVPIVIGDDVYTTSDVRHQVMVCVSILKLSLCQNMTESFQV